MLAKLLKSRVLGEPARDALPEGQRVYAVGDIHGRLDLVDELLDRIDADDAARAPAQTSLIFLGDLIDRGPDSAGVVERLRGLAGSGRRTRYLMGNHEELFLNALDGDRKALKLLSRVGGRETILSYGVDPRLYETACWDELAGLVDAAVPVAHREFLTAFEDAIVMGDYLFVHAGVRPDRPIEAQSVGDLRWIREPFLDHRGRLGKRVVHGHTISEDVEFRPHRIGIDTGAYATGRLTALGLESAEQWVLHT
jgi:serine/threonine protein phosphatase 1